MFRVIWYRRTRGLELEDFSEEEDAIRFASSLQLSGLRCEIGKLDGRRIRGCDA